MSEPNMSEPNMSEPNMSEQIFLDMGFPQLKIKEAFSRFPGRQDLISDYLINSENIGRIPKKIKLDISDTRSLTFYGSKVSYKSIIGTIDGFDITHAVVRFNHGVSSRKWLHVSDPEIEWTVIHHNSIPITTEKVMTWRRQVGTVKLPGTVFKDAFAKYKADNAQLLSRRGPEYVMTEYDINNIWMGYGFRSNSRNALWHTMTSFAGKLRKHVHAPSGIPPRFSSGGEHELRIELMSYFLTLCDFYSIPMQIFTKRLVTCSTELDFSNRVITLFPPAFNPNKSLSVHNKHTFLEMLQIWLNPGVYIAAEIQNYRSKSIPMVEFEATTEPNMGRVVFKVFFSDMTFVIPANQSQALLRVHFQTLFLRMFGDRAAPIPLMHPSCSFWNRTLELSKKNHQGTSKPSAAFISQLLPFQQKALSWMQMREETAPSLPSMGWQRHQLYDGFTFYTDMFGSLSYTRPSDRVRGGILAQDYGLGKTVEMLALIASSECSKPTLVIMPPRSLDSWVEEASKHTPSLSVLKYHGTARNLDNILNINIVLTTFRILKDDKIGLKNNQSLQNVDWGRIVVDDFHKLPTEPLNGSPLQRLNADIKWCMSAKGVSNVKGVGTLFRFFNITPFNTIETNNNSFNKVNNSLIREMLVEMTYSHSESDVYDELPKPVEDVSLEQENKYSTSYHHLINAIRKRIVTRTAERELPYQQRMWHLHDQTLQTWMIQAAVHPSLVPLRAFAEREPESAVHVSAKTTVDNFVGSLGNSNRESSLRGLVEACQAGQETCSICMGNMVRPTLTSCHHVFCYGCIQSCYEHDPRQRRCPLCRKSGVGSTLLELSDQNSEAIEDLFHRFVFGNFSFKIEKPVHDALCSEINKPLAMCPKITYLLEHIARGGKTVVYIQNHRVRAMVLHQLRLAQVRYACIHPPYGTPVYRNQIERSMSEFKWALNVNVFVMGIMINEHKIVLDAADSILFFAPILSGNARDIALRRVIRIGQTKPISVFTLKTKNSIDDTPFIETFSEALV